MEPAAIMSSKILPMKNEESKYVVPGYFSSLLRLASAAFLELRDDDEDNAFEQYNGELVNLALVGALLFTTFLPLYYSESSRVSPESTDSLMDDMVHGYWHQHVTPINFEVIHDWLNCCYLWAATGMFLCTLSCVYFILMLNEAGSNERVILFRRKLGFLNRMPYFFFSYGAVGFLFSLFVHIPLTARTLPGLVVKMTVSCGFAVLYFSALLIPKAAQSLYHAFWVVDVHSEIAISSQDIQEKLQSYFTQVQTNTHAGFEPNYVLSDFLLSLRPCTEQGYRVRLSQGTKLEAVQRFYTKFAREKEMSVDQLLKWLELCKD